MTRWLVAYGATLVCFLGLDAVYLGTIGVKNFKATLGDMIAPNVQIAPAIAFYLLFPIGILIFAVSPAFGTGRWSTALLFGALLGAFAYGTYDLTNWATLRNWTAALSFMDIVWGTVLCGISATVAFFVTRATVGIG